MNFYLYLGRGTLLVGFYIGKLHRYATISACSEAKKSRLKNYYFSLMTHIDHVNLINVYCMLVNDHH